jgi:hypothetical protein
VYVHYLIRPSEHLYISAEKSLFTQKRVVPPENIDGLTVYLHHEAKVI